jgi:hypothetical protein
MTRSTAERRMALAFGAKTVQPRHASIGDAVDGRVAGNCVSSVAVGGEGKGRWGILAP